MSLDRSILAQLSFSKFLLMPGDEIASSHSETYTQYYQSQQWRQIRIGDGNNYSDLLVFLSPSNVSVSSREIEADRRIVEKINGLVIKDFEYLEQCLANNAELTLGFILAYSRANSFIPGDTGRMVVPPLVLLEAARFLHLFDKDTPFAMALRAADAEYRKNISQFEEFVIEKKSQIDVLEQIYADKLKLEEASVYFDSKANNHKWISILSFIAIASIVISGCIYLYSNFVNIFEFISSKPGIKNDHVYIFALIGTIFFGSIAWIMRLLSKIYSQNLLLWSDARQRSVFLRTYLSLRQGGGVSADERERVLVLNAIFRPVGDQKDEDIAPPSLLDLLPKK